MDNEEKTELQYLQEALDVAQEAFEAYFEKNGLEGAYFGYEFHGWTYDNTFSKKLQHASIDNHGTHEREKR